MIDVHPPEHAQLRSNGAMPRTGLHVGAIAQPFLTQVCPAHKCGVVQKGLGTELDPVNLSIFDRQQPHRHRVTDHTANIACQGSFKDGVHQWSTTQGFQELRELPGH